MEVLGNYSQEFIKRLDYVPCDLSDAESLKSLDSSEDTTYFLSVPPERYADAVTNLKEAGKVDDAEKSRVIIEKPFGTDLQSANYLQSVVAGYLREKQVYRIDHYLGKETVQNILMFRFSNSIFERLWNRDVVDHVQITVSEKHSVGGRGGYYEEAGALRDMVQNHLTQILALTAMEPPGRFDAEAIRNEKAKVLQAARLADEEEPWNCCVRGQYGRGGSAAKPMPGYREEPGVNPNSTTEATMSTSGRHCTRSTGGPSKRSERTASTTPMARISQPRMVGK